MAELADTSRSRTKTHRPVPGTDPKVALEQLPYLVAAASFLFTHGRPDWT